MKGKERGADGMGWEAKEQEKAENMRKVQKREDRDSTEALICIA